MLRGVWCVRRTAAAPLVAGSGCAQRRWAAADGPVDAQKRMDEVNLQFGEARELISDARESLGTTDFSDDAEDAMAATKAALALWEDLLADLSRAGRHAERDALERANGQKMKQLNAELDEILHHDD